MGWAFVIRLGAAAVACKPAPPPLKPTEKAAKDRSEYLSASAADAEGAFALVGSCTAE